MMNREEIIAFAYEEYQAAKKTWKLTFEFPEIEFFQKGANAGIAWYSLNKMAFNEVLAKDNGDDFKVTITHELAHLIVHNIYPNAKQHHGPEFKRVMSTMGADPSTYHKFDISNVAVKRTKTRHIYSCQCGIIHELTTQATKKSWHCNICKGSLFSTGEIRKFI